MVCPVLCQSLCNELNYVMQCLARIKAELNASQRKIKIICQDRLKSREKAICHRIVLVVLSATSFTKTVIPLGQCTESVFNLLYQVYRTINVVTKHFLSRSTVNEPGYKQALLSKLLFLKYCTVYNKVKFPFLDWVNYPKLSMINCHQMFLSLSCS